MSEDFIKAQQELMKLLIEQTRLQNELMKTINEKIKLETIQERHRGELLRNEGIKSLYGVQAWVAVIGGLGAFATLIYILLKERV